MLLAAATMAWTMIITAPNAIETVHFADKASCEAAVLQYNEQFHLPREKRKHHADCISNESMSETNANLND